MISPGLEPGTTSVLDWCDNQLHHETMTMSTLHSHLNISPTAKSDLPAINTERCYAAVHRQSLKGALIEHQGRSLDLPFPAFW